MSFVDESFEGSYILTWTGMWMGPKANLYSMEKRKILALPGIESAAFQLIARRYTD
jgi:hypothetical protein